MTIQEKKEPDFPNLVKDESGAVMVEFVICAPFLITIMMAVFYFADVGRFLTSTHQWAAVQTWRTVGKGQTGESNSDSIGFLGYNQLDSLGNVITVTPPLTNIESGGSTGRAIATGIYLSGPGSPFRALDCPNDNYYRGKLLDVQSLEGASGVLTYKNTTYTGPLLGIINAFVGSEDGVTTTAPLTNIDVHYASKGSIMNDPYSVFWGDDAINRVRRVDRYTTLRFPAYDVAYLAHTIISGGLNIIGDIPQIVSDAGMSFGGSSISLSLPSTFEQAQPFRKVDKRINEEAHDVNGSVDFKRRLGDKNKLVAVTGDTLWKLVQ